MPLRSDVRKALKGIKTQSVALDVLYRTAQRGELPYEIVAITYGIQYALDTQRLPGKVDWEVQQLNAQETGRLVVDLLETGLDSAADVPRAIIAKFTQ